MLMREIANAILAREETPFLPAFANNHGAIGLYEKLGFMTRWDPVLIVLQES
ncbi:GNAT family N-acetyltransferase [Sphingomonas sp. AP4-R1]|uniref:GNAT family N-acetyltransferase n=1 Tax=Sphingomonas sp. AP4-R1 TaxID=2735134 RepID=UPI0020A47F93|nr:GNAT family N-acetyltransferase [Sphingomonas sp. AP4-R1]